MNDVKLELSLLVSLRVDFLIGAEDSLLLNIVLIHGLGWRQDKGFRGQGSKKLPSSAKMPSQVKSGVGSP